MQDEEAPNEKPQGKPFADGVVRDSAGGGGKQAKYPMKDGDTSVPSIADEGHFDPIDFVQDDAKEMDLNHIGMDAPADKYPDKQGNDDRDMDATVNSTPGATANFWTGKNNKDNTSYGDLGSTEGPAFGSNYPAGIKVVRRI